MQLTLANLKPARGAHKLRRRIGRGHGSGRGKTAGKGTKGQRARAGGRKGLKRIGLKRVMQRIPKHRGFHSIHARPAIVNVGVLEAVFENGTKITPFLLEKHDLVQNVRSGVKILGEGTLNKVFTFSSCAVSKSAREKIEKAGGKIEQSTT